MNKLVSIIIPVYNAGNKIRRCLDSVLKIKYDKLEIIFIDDGSTDDSSKIIKEYSKKNKNIKYYYKENSGVSSTRNYGINKSLGEYIYFMDCDDEVSPNIINKLVKLLESNNCDFVKCNFYYSTMENKKYDYKQLEITGLINEKEKQNAILFEIINGKIPTFVWTLLVKKDFLLNTNLFNEEIDYMEDKVFYFDLFCKSKNYYITNEKLYYYYFNDFTNKSKEYWIKYLKNVDLVYDALLSISQKYENGMFDKYIINGGSLQINNVIYNIVYKEKKNVVSTYFEKCNKEFTNNIKTIKENKLYSKIIIFLINKRYFNLIYIIYKLKSFRK